MEKKLTFRKGDLFAGVLVVLAAVLCGLLILPSLTAHDDGFARIYQDGELVRQVPLSVDQHFQIRGTYTNTVQVKDGRICVIASDCPTNDCVHQGWRSSGGAIICLPNGVEIRLPSDGTDVSVR